MTPVEKEVEDRWVARRDEFQRLRVSVDGVSLCDEVIADLERLREERDTKKLTLSEAATLSGYSREHLARLIRSGKLANAGRKHSPRVVAADLPRRPRAIAIALSGSYDPSTDARSLRVRR
jgi:hypothetical protein